MLIPSSKLQRIVLLGGGFGGLQLARKLGGSQYQVVLLDKHNYHQFQPLLYQVATSGLEPSSILFPFRKIFQRYKNVHFRMAEVLHVDPTKKCIQTSKGDLTYDHLVIATGASNNFFGNAQIEKRSFPMKSLNESLLLRNSILERFEGALDKDTSSSDPLMTFVIVGGGPTGVELAGTLAEMKRFVLPKDYPELDFDHMKIVLVEGSDRVLSAMHPHSSERALHYLEKLDVEVRLSMRVKDFDGKLVYLSNDETIHSESLIWAAGIKGNFIDGIPEEARGPGNRLRVNAFNQVLGLDDVYAIGDVALMESDLKYPKGHPQMAQVAIQQGRNVAQNFKNRLTGKKLKGFHYRNFGSMATIGRNKAVVELPGRRFAGFFAWLVWMFVHLRSILGVRNKWIVFINWVWNYFTYNLSLRLIIKRKERG
ncbi:MAG: NADH dehydrogenase [Bacteroidetes bacterium RIFCSPHIGHO2_02_FULL_44_7]|nr:MAG: NADH dehydrogenase [Bacteroidetes bacterium RIFCSPHIGHO2_02_FULL_44_7]